MEPEAVNGLAPPNLESPTQTSDLISPATGAFLQDAWSPEKPAPKDFVCPEAVVTTGCVGEYEFLNGVYHKQEALVNDRPCYVTGEYSYIYIYYHASGYWAFSDSPGVSLSDEESLSAVENSVAFGYAIVESTAKIPTLVRDVWKIQDKEFATHIPTPDLKVVAYKKEQPRRKSFKRQSVIRKKKPAQSSKPEEEVVREAPKEVNVSGFLMHTELSGIYFLSDHLYCNRPMYHKDLDDGTIIYIRYHGSGAWLLTSDGCENEEEDRQAGLFNSSEAHGYAVVYDSEAERPTQVSKVWQEFNAHFGQYVKNPKFKVFSEKNPLVVKKTIETKETPGTTYFDAEKIIEEAPEPLNVFGATLGKELLNGKYYKCETLKNGKVFWECNNHEHEVYLCWNNVDNRWQFEEVNDYSLNHNSVIAYCVEDVEYPICTTQPWLAICTSHGYFTDYPQLRIVTDRAYRRQTTAQSKKAERDCRKAQRQDDGKRKKIVAEVIKRNSVVGSVKKVIDPSVKRQHKRGASSMTDVLTILDPVERASSYVFVRGCRNTHLNGKYKICEEDYLSRVMYEKIEENGLNSFLLRWSQQQCWIISDTLEDEIDPFIRVRSNEELPTEVHTFWEEHERQGRFLQNKDIMVLETSGSTGISKHNDDHKSNCEANTSYDFTNYTEEELSIAIFDAPQKIVVTGRVGKNDIVNGMYHKSLTVVDSRVAYQKLDGSCCLRWFESLRTWIFSENLHDDYSGFACCQTNALCPINIEKGASWKICLKFNHHETDTSIRIVSDQVLESNFGRRSSTLRRKKMAVASPSDEYSSSSDLPSPNPELHFPFYKLQDTPSEYPEFLHNANTALSRVLSERLHRKLAKRQTSGGFTFDMCIESGVEYPTDFRAGCLAGDKDSYVAFGPLFKQIIMDSHQGYDIDRFHHQNSFLDQSFAYFDATIDLDYFKSCRIRADRSLFGFNFPVHQGKSDRVTVERILVRACNNIENEDFHGAYSNFKDIDEDFLCQLRSHYGIKRSKYCVDDYPNNRGVFASSDNRFSVWMNEDEHCSIVCASVEANLNDVFTHMANALDIVETELVKQGCKFLEDGKLGYMLCNPLSTGTGLEISVIVQFRLLHRFVQFSEILENLRLHSRSVNFEEGIICLSNVDRIGYSEIETMKLVVSGVNRLINLEKALSVKQNIADSIPAPIYPPWSPLKTKSSLAARLKQAHVTHERLKLLGSAPETVVVSGRKGTNNIVNGVYLKGEDTFNGRPYYERCGLEASVFLRYHSSGLWIFSEDLSNSLHGYAKFRSTAQYPHLIREVVLVFYENMFKIDWNVTVKEHDGLNYQPLLNTDTHWEAVSFKMFPEESLNEASTAPTYIISRHVSREKKLGRRKTLLEDMVDEEPQNCNSASQYLEILGNHPLISGKYSLVEGQTHDGRCYWKKSDGSYNCYIRWHHQGLWIISDFLTEGRRGYALVQDNAADPTMVENEWKVLQNKKYQYQPGFRVIIDTKSVLVE